LLAGLIHQGLVGQGRDSTRKH